MDVIVIGAGIGGLSAAIHLAARGVRVQVIEKNSDVGGKLNIWEKDGFRFDTGPHILTMPWAIDEIFRAAGSSLTQELSPVALPTICRYHFTGSATAKLDAPADPELAEREIESFAPGEGGAFRRFLRYARRVSDVTTDPFLRQDFGAEVRGVPTAEQWRQGYEFLQLRPWRSLRSVVRSTFRDPRLRQIFELYALYSGSHPARCSAIFATVADVQWRQGTFYLAGGMYTLARALRRTAERVGVRFAMDTPVTEITVKAGRARGVLTADGTRIFSDVVVCNADALAAIKGLVPLQNRRRWTDKRVNSIEPSTSAFVLLLGVEGTYPQLSHHNSFLAADLNEEFRDIFDLGVPAADPTIGVACQTVTDSSAAPPGCSNLFVMTNPPALNDAFDWDADGLVYRDQVLRKLEAMGLSGLRRRIAVEQMWTPRDLEARYGSWRGAIYGLSSNGMRNGFFRPPQRSPDVKHLYFVGGSTHPGGGLPLCALSGTNVARAILSEFR